MRTKTLLLTAALSAAGVAASMAQVYSVNVVGYVNTTVPQNGWAILANPLNNSTNDIATLLPVPGPCDGSADAAYDGASIFRFDAAKGGYMDVIQYVAGLGWYDLSAATPLNTGEGFWIKAPAATAMNFTFVGEVQQGTMALPLKGGGTPTTGKWNLLGAQVPQSIGLGDTATPNTTMNFPALDGDTVFIFDTTKQAYGDAWQYIEGAGWLTATDDQHPEGPTIAPGTGFWVFKNGVASQSWSRTFYVQ